MPVSPNNLQFSLSSDYLERLKEKANPGESLGLTAKRLLIELLKNDHSLESPSSPSPDLIGLVDRIADLEEKVVDMTALEERVTAIEVAIENEHFPGPTVSDEREGEPADPPRRSGMPEDGDYGNHNDRVYVVYSKGESDLVPVFWGGKAGWVRERSAALTFDSLSKVKAQVTRSIKKYPDRADSIGIDNL